MTDDPKSNENAHPLIRWALGFYSLAVGYVGVDILVSAWQKTFSYLPIFHSIPNGAIVVKPSIAMAYVTVGGSLIGGVLRSFKGLHRYTATSNSFKKSYAGSYLIGPWVAGALGLVVYVVTRAGLLVFGNVSNVQSVNDITYCGFIALGFFSGFAWEQVIERLGIVAKQMFSGASTNAGRTTTGNDTPRSSS